MIRNDIQSLITQAVLAAQAAGALPEAALPEVVIEQPQRSEHGDYATPLAMGLARPMRRAPRQIAETIVRFLAASPMISSVEIAGPGYINLHLNKTWLVQQIDRVLALGERFADAEQAAGKAQVEFISANPTGPLTVGHARNAVLGDVMANVLSAAGYTVTREYYFNDGGLQMKNLAESVRLRAIQEQGEPVDFPVTYYQGEYISEIARDLLACEGPSVVERDWTFFRDQAVEAIFADIRRTQERLGVRFDVYTNEMAFFDQKRPGNVWEVVARLHEVGATYEADEATWFRATAFGADKDRVLLRSVTASLFAALRAAQARLGIPYQQYSNEQTAAFYDRSQPENVWEALRQARADGLIYEQDGATWLRATRYGAEQDRVLWEAGRKPDPTYRLPDIAYHIDKLDRGFDRVVDVLGSDHIAQFPDVRAALLALGYDASRVQVLAYQFVTLVQGGEQIKMSTRRANYATLDDLIDEVGADVVRFFMLMRSADAPIEFDLDLAKEQSDVNPVFYVQFAYARTAGVLERVAPERGIIFDPEADVTLLTHPSEIALVREILRLGEVIEECTATLELHHLTHYARDLATAFSMFYRDCPVLTAPEPGLIGARMKLVKATQVALARTLGLIGVHAPDTM